MTTSVPEPSDPAVAPTGGVPAGFDVRAHRWLIGVLVVGSVAQWLGLLAEFNGLNLFIAVGITFATVSQWSWQARVTPNGVSWVNRVGVDWSYTWEELRGPVAVVRPGKAFGSLLRARLASGRWMHVPNGQVRVAGGASTVAPETAQRMMQAWADAGATIEESADADD